MDAKNDVLKGDVADYMYAKLALLNSESSVSTAACAKLLRALGKPLSEANASWDIILSGMPEKWYTHADVQSREQLAVYTALTLYALHRQSKGHSMHTKNVSFGAALGTLVLRDKSKRMTIKRRFDAVLTAVDFTELTHHMRTLVQLLRTSGVKMDYALLAKDLVKLQWADSDQLVRLKWGEDFYRIAHI